MAASCHCNTHTVKLSSVTFVTFMFLVFFTRLEHQEPPLQPSFGVNNSSFHHLNSNTSLGNNLHSNFYSASLHKRKNYLLSHNAPKRSLFYIFLLLLAKSPDIECNPGPTINSTSDLKIQVTNFQSIWAKKEVFWGTLDSTSPDIVIASETFLYPAKLTSEVIPTGYVADHLRKDRSSTRGGVAIIHKDDLTSERIPIISQAQIVAAKFVTDHQQLIVAAVYRPPTSNDMAYAQALCDAITNLNSAHPDATLWIGGDFNLPDVDWSTMSTTSYQYTVPLNKLFLDCFDQNSLTQMVTFPTRESNTLDIFLTNRPSLISDCSPLPGVSDHETVLVSSSLRARRRKPPKRNIRLWGKANLAGLREDLLKFSTDFVTNFNKLSDINFLWSKFESACLTALENHVPEITTSTRFSQPWINRNTKRLSRRKKKAFNRAKLSKKPSDWDYYKSLKKQTQLECRKTYNTFINKIVSDDNKNKFWKYIKSKRQDNTGVSPLLSNGISHNNNTAKANILNDQFSSVFTKESTENLPTLPPKTANSMPEITISVKGVSTLLSKLKPNKASGPDGISSRLLKEAGSSIAPALSLIFEASITQGKVPLIWKKAHVSPLFKKGDRHLASNYRPISLTSISCKLLEHILFTNIMSHLETENILSTYQHGFRRRRSCESQLLLTIHDLASSFDKRQQIDAILLDFSKAFDKVPHQRLLMKLDHYGIEGNTLRWIGDFLSGRTQSVILDGDFSETAPVVSGVPQGTVLGPLLFLIYINDLPDRVSSNVRIFADDTLLYRTISSPNDSLELQRDLDSLQDWEDKWLMSFNPEKCEVLRITNKKTIIPHDYSIHGQNLKVVEKAKYLGLTISSKLCWKDHINNITKKANSTRGFIQRNLRTAPANVKTQAYQTFVRPSLEYASTIWDPPTKDLKNKVESVQRKAARWVSNDWKRTSSVTTMLNNLKWQTLQQRRTTNKLIMVYKITHCLVAIPHAPPYFHRPNVSTRGHNQQLWLPRHNTNVLGSSFFPSIVLTWNSLPQPTIDAPSVDAFRSRLAALPLP